MPRPYSSKAIANYFIDKAKEDGVNLSPMKLQKLIYFAFGWNLAINDDRLINEKIEAWKFGPVISSLYRATKEYGNKSIKSQLFDVEFIPDEDDDFGFDVKKSYPSIDDNDEETSGLLDKVWEVYGDYSAMQLSNMTHRDGTPWSNIYSPNIPPNTDIDDEAIKEYFINLAQG